MDDDQTAPKATVVAAELGSALEQRGQEYALGGALALGYWTEPRATVDVDLTLFVSLEDPLECLRVLREIGCAFSEDEAAALLQEHGFCRTTYLSRRVDVFFPSIPFYEAAKARRRRVPLLGAQVMIWDAETLAVFKMMFFRRKDIADVEQMMRSQGALDRQWIREQLVEMYGRRDARVAQWDELTSELAP